MQSEPRDARITVWALPRSLAATYGIDVSFSSSGYLDVSVPRVPSVYLWIQYTVTEVCSAGFPHSDIRGSRDICSSPRLFAAYHVFHRLLVPRHPPYALFCLTSRLILQSPLICSVISIGLCNLLITSLTFVSVWILWLDVLLIINGYLLSLFLYDVFKVQTLSTWWGPSESNTKVLPDTWRMLCMSLSGMEVSLLLNEVFLSLAEGSFFTSFLWLS